MGLFSSPSNKYSQKLQPFPLEDFKKIFRDLNVESLTKDEEELVYSELESHRSGDGKLSLRDIYKVIYNLKYKNKISENDQKILMNTFVNYFSKFDK